MTCSTNIGRDQSYAIFVALGVNSEGTTMSHEGENVQNERQEILQKMKANFKRIKDMLNQIGKPDFNDLALRKQLEIFKENRELITDEELKTFGTSEEIESVDNALKAV